MPFSHYYGLWKNIPHCLTQIQMGLAGRLPCISPPLPTAHHRSRNFPPRYRRLPSKRSGGRPALQLPRPTFPRGSLHISPAPGRALQKLEIPALIPFSPIRSIRPLIPLPGDFTPMKTHLQSEIIQLVVFTGWSYSRQHSTFPVTLPRDPFF